MGGCKKDPFPKGSNGLFDDLPGYECDTLNADTIFPYEYYPVFPGSWWRYLDSNQDTVTWNATGYGLHNYIDPWGNTSECVYVPFIDYQWGVRPIYGDKGPIVTYDYNDGYELIKIVSDTLGESWGTSKPNKGGFYKTVLAVDTSIQVNNTTYTDVVLIGNYAYSNSNFVSLYGLTYYAKDVGIIRSDGVGNDTTTSKSLIDYYIAN